MPKITAIEQQKNNTERVNVFLDGKFAFGIHASIFYKFKLSLAQDIDIEFIDNVLKEEEFSKSKRVALNYISTQDRTKKEVLKKLADKGYEECTINKTIAALEGLGLIDDESYCERYISDKVRFSKYGKNKIVSNLILKGIDKKIISQKIIDIEDESEFEKAFKLGEKKYNSLISSNKQNIRQKVQNHLLQKGFDYNTTGKVINKLFIK